MSAIGKGDWVQCIDAIECKCGCGPSPLRHHAVYVVEGVCNHVPSSPGITLVGVPTPGDHHCFPLRIFRPLGGSALTKTREAPADLVTA